MKTKLLHSYWRRPYQRVTLEGVAPISIVAFRKRPYQQKQHATENEAYIYISKYAYGLAIDLWVVVLRFDWVGRERPDPGVAGSYDG